MKKITKQEYLVGVTNDVKINMSHVRQLAKSPFFLLQYDGTYIGMVRQFGFSVSKAKFIENSHHNLYIVSDRWVKKKLKKAKTTGYVEGIFGLRLRTHLINNPKAKKYEVAAEMRSAGNMITQSYGLLTIRALTKFMYRVWDSKFATEIRPISTIYDSIYLDIPDTVEAVIWTNKHLIECMEDISGCPELEHEIVKLGAELEVYPENWSKGITIPNDADSTLLKQLSKSYWKN